jgi:hypothetical protein
LKSLGFRNKLDFFNKKSIIYIEGWGRAPATTAEPAIGHERLIMSKLAYRKTIAFPSIAKLFVEAWFTSESKACLYSALDTNPQWVAWRLQRASEVQGYNTTREAVRSFHAYIRSKSSAMPLFSTLRATPDTMTGQDMNDFITTYRNMGPCDLALNVTSLRAQNGN